MNDLCIGDLAEIVGGRLRLGVMPPLGGDLEPVLRVVADSRRVETGDVFWGLPGRHVDGSRFADEAFARGALGAVVSRRSLEPWAGKFSIEIDDTQRGLWQLARWNRCRFRGHVIAVSARARRWDTSRLGDTKLSVTSAMILRVLSRTKQGRAAGNAGRPRVDLPLAMLQAEEWHDFVIHELNGDQWEETKALADLCCPHMLVIDSGTSLGDGDQGTDGVGDEGRPERTWEFLANELLDTLPDQGCLVLNGDDLDFHRIAKRRSLSVTRCGKSPGVDVAAKDVRQSNQELSFRVEAQRFLIPNLRRRHLSSALAAIAVGRIHGLPLSEISAALGGYQPAGIRCEFIKRQNIIIILDSSAGNAIAMNAALHVLRDFRTRGRRIVVCGDLSENHASTEQTYRRFGDAVVTACGADLLIATGASARVVVEGAREAGMPKQHSRICADAAQASWLLQHRSRPGDTILLKGLAPRELDLLVQSFGESEQRRAA